MAVLSWKTRFIFQLCFNYILSQPLKEKKPPVMLWVLRCERVSNVACQSHPDKRRSVCNNTSLLCFTPTHWVQRLPQNTTACICDLQGLGIGRRTWWLAIFLVEIQNSNFVFHLSDSEPPLATCTNDSLKLYSAHKLSCFCLTYAAVH